MNECMHAGQGPCIDRPSMSCRNIEVANALRGISHDVEEQKPAAAINVHVQRASK